MNRTWHKRRDQFWDRYWHLLVAMLVFLCFAIPYSVYHVRAAKNDALIQANLDKWNDAISSCNIYYSFRADAKVDGNAEMLKLLDSRLRSKCDEIPALADTLISEGAFQ